MRVFAYLPAILFVLASPVAAQDKKEEKKDDSIKFDMSYLEKTFGMKCKSHAVEDNPLNRNAGKIVKILLEFTKDAENLTELRKAFTLPLRSGVIGPNTPVPQLWFYFFDEDNVLLAKYYLSQIDGEVSGKMGDAIRVYVYPSQADVLKKTRKIEVRPVEMEKKKETKSK